MAQKILNGVHISGTTQIDFMPTHESEGIITLGRYDANTSRYHNIKSYVSSTEASNYLKFSLHNGTANTVVDVLTLNGNKDVIFAGKVGIGTTPSAPLHIAGTSGSVAGSALLFNGSTAIWQPTDATLAIRPGGTDAATFSSTNTTFTGNVGVGDSPTNVLGFLEKAINISAGTSSSSTLQQAGLVISGSSDADDADDFGYLSFTNHQSTLSADRVAEIRAYKAGSNVDTGKLLFYTANGSSLVEALQINEAQQATFASEITSGDDINSPTKIVVGEGAAPEVRLKKTNAGNAKLSFYNNDGSSSTQQSYLSLDATENIVLYGASGVGQYFYAGGVLNETKIGANSTFAGNVDSQGYTINESTLAAYHDFQSRPIDADSGLFTVGGHGMQAGYSRSVSMWSSTNGVWNSWVGTNLRWDGTNFKRASDNGGQNWGNIAGIRFLGNNGTSGAAIQFIIDPPEFSNPPSGEQTIGTSLPSSMTALSINNDLSTTFAGTVTSAKTFISTSVGTGNPTPATDNVRFNGYGMIGNRGNLYITNSNSSGTVQIGVGGAHNGNPKLTIGGSTSQISTNLNPGADSTYNIGSSASRFSNIYADTLYGDGSNITGVTTTDSTKVAKAGDTMTGNLVITHADTPQLEIIDTTNDVDFRIKSANSYVYLEADRDNDADSTRMLIKVDDNLVHEFMPGSQLSHKNLTLRREDTHPSYNFQSRRDSGNFTAGVDIARINFQARDSVVTSDTTLAGLIVEADNTFTATDKKTRMKWQLSTGASMENVLFLDSDKSATFYGKITLPDNKAAEWPNGSIRAEGNILKLVATTLIDLQDDTQVQGDLIVKGDEKQFWLKSDDQNLARIIPRGTTGDDVDKGLFSLIASDSGSGQTNVEKVRIDSAGNSWFDGGNVSFGSNVTIAGALTVNGTTTTLNTTTVEVEDNILQLNTTQGSPDTATAATSGISIYRGDGVTQASFIFDDGDDTWDLTNNLSLGTGRSLYLNGTTGLRLLHDGSNAHIINGGTGDLNFKNDASNKDIYFSGVDGSSNVTALTLDMSEGGNATFSGNVDYKPYPMPSTSSTAGWYKVGTLSSFPQNGNVAVIEMEGHAGYNAANNQDFCIKIYFKTSNGNGGGPNNQNFNSWYERTGLNSSHIEIVWKTSATNVYDLYMYLPVHTLGGYYKVRKRVGSWAHSAASASDPGANSSTILEAVHIFNVDGDATFAGNATFSGDQVRVDTAGGGFYLRNTSGAFRGAFHDNGTTTNIFGDGNGSTPAISIDSNNSTFGGNVTVDGTTLNLSGTSYNFVTSAANVDIGVSSSAHNVAGYTTLLYAGSPTAGTTNNIAGGHLYLAGGAGKGTGAGGDIIFRVAPVGSSGSTVNAYETALTISDDKSATFTGVLSLTDGSAGAPAISNTGDANTGMYWPGDHQVGFTVNNSRKFYIAETKAYFQNLSSGVEINAGGIDVTGDSTFAGDVDVTRSSTGQILSRIWNSNTGGNGTAVMRIANSGNQANGARLEFSDNNYYNATVSVDRTNGIRFMVHDDSTSMSDLLTHTALTLATNKNATFAGDIVGSSNNYLNHSNQYNNSTQGVIGFGNAAMDTSISYYDTGKTVAAATRGIVWTGKHYIVTDYSAQTARFYDSNFDAVKGPFGDTISLPNDGNTDHPHGAAWDGRYLYCIQYTGSGAKIVAYDLDNGTSTATIVFTKTMNNTTATYDIEYADGHLYTVTDGAVSIYRLDGQTITHVSTSGNILNGLEAQAITYDGSYLWATQNGYSMYKVRLNATLAATLTTSIPPDNVAMAWNGRNIATVNHTNGKVYIVNNKQTRFDTELFQVSGGNLKLESGTGGTTNKLIFKTTDNADENKFIRTNAYWLEFGGHANEGFKFIDTSGTVLLQMNGGQQTGGNGANSATFAGGVTVGGTGTFSSGVTATQVKLNNNVGNTNADSFFVYTDGGSTSYGMTLWNNNAASGEWATMIYGPNQSNRRISFGKANGNFGTNHAGIDELAFIDLDDGSFNADGGATFGGDVVKAHEIITAGNQNSNNNSSGADGRYATGVLDLSTGGTPSYFRIATNIPFNLGGADFTVTVEGFRYGSRKPVSLQICWHIYPANTPYNHCVISNGGWSPVVKIAKNNTTDNLEILLESPGYWPKMYVKSLHSSNYEVGAYAKGWTWADGDFSSGYSVVTTVPYQSLSLGSGGINNTGAITGATTITASGAITGGNYTGSSGIFSGDNTTSGIIRSAKNIVSNSTYNLISLHSTRTVDDYGGLGKNYMQLNLVTPGPNTDGGSSAHGFGSFSLKLADNASSTSMNEVLNITAGGTVSMYSSGSSQTVNIGRNASERLMIEQTDQETVLTADNDSDTNGTHNFRLNRTFEGTGANNFIIQKDGVDQLHVDTHGNVVIKENVTHKGLSMTEGADVDQYAYFPMTFQLVADTWTDTGIDGSDMSTGTYAMQVYVSDFGVGGGHYYEYYSGMMSWYGQNTNSGHVDEIVVHRAGHAPNNGDVQFRTERHASGNLMLQVKHNISYSAALDDSHGGKIFRFKFRRLI